MHDTLSSRLDLRQERDFRETGAAVFAFIRQEWGVLKGYALRTLLPVALLVGMGNDLLFVYAVAPTSAAFVLML